MLQVVLTEYILFVYNSEIVIYTYIYADLNIICMHKNAVENV
jgi:hypothetical protein